MLINLPVFHFVNGPLPSSSGCSTSQEFSLSLHPDGQWSSIWAYQRQCSLEILLPNQLLLSNALECYLRELFAWNNIIFTGLPEDNSSPAYGQEEQTDNYIQPWAAVPDGALWALLGPSSCPSTSHPLQHLLELSNFAVYSTWVTYCPPGSRVWADTPLLEAQPSPVERRKSMQHEYFTELEENFCQGHLCTYFFVLVCMH